MLVVNKSCQDFSISVHVNLRSGVPYIFCRGGKVRLIQLLDYLSVSSPESGLSLIGQETKRYLELSHDWLPLWGYDFR